MKPTSSSKPTTVRPRVVSLALALLLVAASTPVSAAERLTVWPIHIGHGSTCTPSQLNPACQPIPHYTLSIAVGGIPLFTLDFGPGMHSGVFAFDSTDARFPEIVALLTNGMPDAVDICNSLADRASSCRLGETDFAFLDDTDFVGQQITRIVLEVEQVSLTEELLPSGSLDSQGQFIGNLVFEGEPAPPPPPPGGCTTPDPFVALGGGTCVDGGWLPPGIAPPGSGEPAPPPPPSDGCTTPDPFVALGGGTCVNGGWLPPGVAPPGSGEPAPPPPPPPSGGCTTPDPFVALGGGTCVNGGWLPPGVAPPSNGEPAPPPPPSPSDGCTTPDPFVALGGGTCVNGGWLPPGAAPPGSGEPAPPPPPPSSGGCTTPDPFVALGGGTCVNGGWLPPGAAPGDPENPPAPVDLTGTWMLTRTGDAPWITTYPTFTVTFVQTGSSLAGTIVPLGQTAGSPITSQVSAVSPDGTVFFGTESPFAYWNDFSDGYFRLSLDESGDSMTGPCNTVFTCTSATAERIR